MSIINYLYNNNNHLSNSNIISSIFVSFDKNFFSQLIFQRNYSLDNKINSFSKKNYSILYNNVFKLKNINNKNYFGIYKKLYNTNNYKFYSKFQERKKYFRNVLVFTSISIFSIYRIYSINKSDINNFLFNSKAFLTKSFKFLKNTYESPYNDIVLLDKIQHHNEPTVKTLILNLNKTLVCYKYSIKDGFKIISRPGLAYFIDELSNKYEIVLIGEEDPSLIEYISNKIDKDSNKIKYKLGREAMKIYRGKLIKDLKYFNRNLLNTIIIDFSLTNVPFNKNNTILIPEFNGDGKDRELFFLVPFLKEMACPKIQNIQKEINKYGNMKPYIEYYKLNKKYQKMLP